MRGDILATMTRHILLVVVGFVLRIIFGFAIKFVLRTILGLARIVTKEKFRGRLVPMSEAVDRRSSDF